jgi:hypothetical protein
MSDTALLEKPAPIADSIQPSADALAPAENPRLTPTYPKKLAKLAMKYASERDITNYQALPPGAETSLENIAIAEQRANTKTGKFIGSRAPLITETSLTHPVTGDKIPFYKDYVRDM